MITCLHSWAISKQTKLGQPTRSQMKDLLQSFKMVMDFEKKVRKKWLSHFKSREKPNYKTFKSKTGHEWIPKYRYSNLFQNCGQATLHLFVLVSPLVGSSLCNIFELRMAFALQTLPNCTRLSCLVTGLVSFLVADTRLYTLPCWSVHLSVGRLVTFLNSEWFLYYCSCPTVRNWAAVYPALLNYILIYFCSRDKSYCRERKWVLLSFVYQY